MSLVRLQFVVCLTTWICEVEVSVRLQMYVKKPGSIPEFFGANLEWL